ncbi:hypothetical protein [Streptomyces sp. DSM 40750]|uniref:hypothetical protein n=1 Tax=Streptomyces sp. DSM 40750 TaxID=2801030 RepID=UPI00214B4831|nr:hypothetical protein [Streptomyces sp. DSM 40750]UUU19164.1 hypothetical protein JIX55_01815 [Streptomyces sp. DSM 40750]UUU27492.1 hypothetical protein JIX55_48930 [Streptomyces sp. DSM 40750]
MRGDPVHLQDIWPDPKEIAAVMAGSIDAAMFTDACANRGHLIAESDQYPRPDDVPYGYGFPRHVVEAGRAANDPISPAGAITVTSAAAQYLTQVGAPPRESNTYTSRRGNHQVMMRGVFANVRLRNQVVPAPVAAGPSTSLRRAAKARSPEWCHLQDGVRACSAIPGALHP